MRDESAALQSALHAADELTVAERSKVVSLWHERVRRSGLSERWRPDFSALSRRALSELAEQHRALYLHALPVMELLHQQILNTHSMVLLTDERGLIMHALGDGDFLEKAEQVALKPGVLWSEDSKGTNAIGTALVERRATLVHGSEHFLTVNRFLTCSCSPIHGPRGELIGALDVSGPQEGYHPHTMGLVRISTHMIENQLFVDEFGQSLRIHFHPRTELLGTLLEGIAAFDEAGRMLAANANARSLLGLAAGQLAACSLDSLFEIDVPSLLARRGAAGTLVRLTLRSGQAVLARVEPNALAARRAVPPVSPPRPAAPVPSERAPTLADLDTGDPAIAAVIGKIRKVQGHVIPILILGETGTGKELLAHAIHNESERRTGPFIPVDCASLPESLIEAELFGYEEGAFTGARRRGNPGKILLADGGTLFLDEIGDMPLSLQAKLLRFLQERLIERLGGREAIPVDVRVIAATHRDLKAQIARGRFREDLYYRLGEVPVVIPPLRERGSDAVLIAGHLLQQSCRRHGIPTLTLAPDAIATIERHAWPGNVRELENRLNAAVIMSEGKVIRAADLSLGPVAPEATEVLPLREVRRQAEAAAVQQALKITGGNIARAAELLGVTRPTFYVAMQRAFRRTPRRRERKR